MTPSPAVAISGALIRLSPDPPSKDNEEFPLPFPHSHFSRGLRRMRDATIPDVRWLSDTQRPHDSLQRDLDTLAA